MKTIIYQSYRTEDVPGWISHCMESVRKWADTNKFDYRFIDDELFSYVPDWYREKVDRQINLVSDLARLNLARKYLDEGYDRTIWIDADIIIFHPEHFHISIANGYGFCHEVFTKISPEGEITNFIHVNNAITVFEKNNKFLDFYIYSCEQIVRNKKELTHTSVGTQFLTATHHFLCNQTMRNMGLLSPLIMNSIAGKKKHLMEMYMKAFGSRMFAANLCASYRNRNVQGISMVDDIYETVISQLNETKGDILNHFLPSASRDSHIIPVTERSARIMHSSSSPPLVSVITPTYNRAGFLQEAIESVLDQTFGHWEMIIVSDGSTDNTAEIVKNYSARDARIRFCEQENQGISIARNNAITKAEGKYLAFLDSDDIYFPNALEDLVKAIRESPPEVKLVYGRFEIFTASGDCGKLIDAAPPMPRPKLYFQFLLSGGNPILPSASIAEKASIVKVGMFKGACASCEDRELWTRLIKQYDIAKVDSTIVRYRRHDNQMTKKRELRRYYMDLGSLQLFKSLSFQELFPLARNDFDLAVQLDSLAKMMLSRRIAGLETGRGHTTDDTALYILKLAQTKHYRKKRERFIKKLEEDIPVYLKTKFNSTMRIPPEELVL
ncbi:glycosyltransferase family 2 protein [Thermodesulfobacteriota bacterium]